MTHSMLQTSQNNRDFRLPPGVSKNYTLLRYYAAGSGNLF
jgi:hypothetical protein